jgi:hypothetical protein
LEAAKKFHVQSIASKLPLQINRHNVGYLPFKGWAIRYSHRQQLGHQSSCIGFSSGVGINIKSLA